MPRLNIERQNDLEPTRLGVAVNELGKLGFLLAIFPKKIQFLYKGESVTFFPYSGWHSGKTIKDGRGLQNLLNQLKENV